MTYSGLDQRAIRERRGRIAACLNCMPEAEAGGSVLIEGLCSLSSEFLDSQS